MRNFACCRRRRCIPCLQLSVPLLALLPPACPHGPCSDLAGNELSGRLPARWARLGALERLHLDGNRLTGALPATWNMLEGIEYM